MLLLPPPNTLLDELQAWDAAVASGAAALSTLQRAMGELEDNSSSSPAAAKETVELYQRLLQLAPSFQLEAYIQQQQSQKQRPTASDAASHIHEAVGTLRDAVAAAQEHLTALQHTCGQYQDTVLSPASAPQLQDTGLAGSNTDSGAAATGGSSDAGDAGASQEALTGDNNAATDTAEVETGTSEAEAEAPPTEADIASTDSKGVLQPEEVALLMDAVLSGMERDLQWMEAAVDGISLETTPEELSTLSTYWQLQPFTNEAAVATLVEAVVAAADGAAAE